MIPSNNYKSIAREAMEAIAYQGSSSGLFRDLTAAFRVCADKAITDQKSYMALNMGDIVFRHTGLAIQFKLDGQVGLINACAMPVLLDGNSPLLQVYRELKLGALVDAYTTTHEKILPICRDLRGMIDLKRGKVSGVFSKIPTDILMGSGLWLNNFLTPEECAAVCIHEIGHVFTYFESLLWTTSTNITLASAKRDINKMTDPNERIKLVFEVAEFMQAKIDDAERLADPKLSDVTFSTVFLSAATSPDVRTSSGSNTYDMRSSEVVADQFAARHGAGRHIVTGLYKMHASAHDTRLKPVWMHFVSEVVKIGVYVGITVTGAAASLPTAGVYLLISAAIYLGLANPELKIYDDPKERFERVKHDLIQSLKTQRYSPKERQILVDDIAEIEAVIKTMHNRRTFMNTIWILVTPNRRRQYSQMKIEQELEKLVDNDIFVRAAQLQSIQTK